MFYSNSRQSFFFSFKTANINFIIDKYHKKEELNSDCSCFSNYRFINFGH